MSTTRGASRRTRRARACRWARTPSFARPAVRLASPGSSCVRDANTSSSEPPPARTSLTPAPAATSAATHFSVAALARRPGASRERRAEARQVIRGVRRADDRDLRHALHGAESLLRRLGIAAQHELDRRGGAHRADGLGGPLGEELALVEEQDAGRAGSTSLRMCVERTTVWSRPSSRTTSRASRIWLGSRPAVGSSRMTMGGRATMRRRGRPLAVALGEVRDALAGDVEHARLAHGVVDPPDAVATGHALELRAEAEKLDDAHLGIEGRRLRHVADRAPGLEGVVADVVAGDLHGARGGAEEAGEDAERRALAAPLGRGSRRPRPCRSRRTRRRPRDGAVAAAEVGDGDQAGAVVPPYPPVATPIRRMDAIGGGSPGR